MSKHDGQIRAEAEIQGPVETLLYALGQVPGPVVDRHDAMAQYLSGEDGWRDARAALRGTFAGVSRDGTGLTRPSDK